MTRDEVLSCLIFPGFATPQQIALRNQGYHKLILEFDTIEEIEKFLDGEFHRYGLEGTILGHNHSPSPSHVTDILKFFLSDCLVGTYNHDAVFNWHKKFKYERYAIPDASRLGSNCQNLSRWSNGELKDHKSLRAFIKNKALITLVAYSVIKNEDPEGLAHLLKIGKFHDHAIANLPTWLKLLDPKNSGFYELLAMPPDEQFSISHYINNLYRYAESDFSQKMNEVYNKDTATKIGNEVLFAIKNLYSKTAEDLAFKVTKDGGDWYLGYKQIKIGHSAYLDFTALKRNPEDELNEIISSFNVRTAKDELAYIRGIVRGVPKELAVKLAKSSPPAAEKFMILRQDEAFLPFVSLQARRDYLGKELNI